MFPILLGADSIQAEKNNANDLFLKKKKKASYFVLLHTEVPVSIVCRAAPESSAFASSASNREHH